MSALLEKQTSLPWISSAAAFPARTCPAQARAQAFLVHAQACGVSSLAFLASFSPGGLSWKTLPAVRENGSTRSCLSWNGSAMLAYRSRCQRAMSALRIEERESSLLPTLTVAGNHNRKGASPNSGDGLRTALLPTLSACSYGSNKGGAAGREGPERPSLETRAKRGTLPTLTASAADRSLSGSGANAQGGPNLAETLRDNMLPTLTTRDDEGPAPTKKTKGGKDLPGTIGGHLNPHWCEAFMGFPEGWLDVDDALVFVRSATRSFRSKQRSSGG
jgi:hypothetical protein